MDHPTAKKPSLVIVVGPTASGKSEYAVRLAKKINGEIISADSRQVYRGLNVGTGKISGTWNLTRPGLVRLFIYKLIPHYCIDCVSPKKIYTVAEFQSCADSAIQDITNREKIPIIVGGTGFWIDTILRNISIPDVLPNQKLRKNLEKKTPAELFSLLKKLDSRRAKTIEQKNPRRLIRAIEIVRALGAVPRRIEKQRKNVIWIGLDPGKEKLEKNITIRARRMIACGLIEEVKKLRAQRVAKKRIHEFGFEYQLALQAAEGKLTHDELLTKLTQKTKRYARKQMMWWKKNKEIYWIYKNPTPEIFNKLKTQSAKLKNQNVKRKS